MKYLIDIYTKLFRGEAVKISHREMNFFREMEVGKFLQGEIFHSMIKDDVTGEQIPMVKITGAVKILPVYYIDNAMADLGFIAAMTTDTFGLFEKVIPMLQKVFPNATEEELEHAILNHVDYYLPELP